MINFVYNKLIPNEQNIRSQGITYVFFCIQFWAFEIFNETLIFFVRN